MVKSQHTTEVMHDIRHILQQVVRILEVQSQRMSEVVSDLARVKDAQNQMLAGLALYERARRLKESLSLEEKHSEPEEDPWQNIQAYCRNCTRMMPIIEPIATLLDDHTTIEAKCRNCGTKVIRTLL